LAEVDGFELELPLQPAYVVCGRLFTASLARFYGCDEGTTDDLKVAVSEACANAIERPATPARPIRVVVNRQGSRLLFEIENGGVPTMAAEPDGGAVEHASTEELARILGMELVRSLFPDASVRTNRDGGHDLAFSVATPE
jgi:anti-sigma regulatory factor (Ser/Thr protein kinase)